MHDIDWDIHKRRIYKETSQIKYYLDDALL